MDKSSSDQILPEVVEIGEGVIYQKLNDEAVLLELSSQRYFGLNHVGTKMWQFLLDDGNVESLISRLGSVYDTTEAVLREDVTQLIRELLAANLLKVPASL